MGIIQVINPTASRRGQMAQPRRSLDGIGGKVVGFIDNSKPNFNHLVDDLADLLQKEFGVSTVIKRRKRVQAIPAPDEVITELAEACDLVVAGSGD